MEPRSKRQKVDKAGRGAAFERLKQLKGCKHKYQVGDVNDVFDVVDEKEYSRRVLERQESDWIVDDECGYVEDGREIFEDEGGDFADDGSGSRRSKGAKRSFKGPLAGKANIKNMLSSIHGKKHEEISLDEDDVLTSLISEIDPSSSKASSNVTEAFKVTHSNRSIESNYLKTFAVAPCKVTLKKEAPKEKVVEDVATVEAEAPPSPAQPEEDEDEEEEEELPVIPEEMPKKTEEKPMLDYDMNCEYDEAFDSVDLNEICKVEEKAPKGVEFKETFTEFCKTSGSKVEDAESQKDLLPVDNDDENVFRFFWWDAFEDVYKMPGVVFLFGKTFNKAEKKYVSCCVKVENIERRIFLLPRPFVKKEGGFEDQSKPVSIMDVYKEFDQFADALQLPSFSAKKVTKNYAMDPSIPIQSEYLEVKYSAKYPSLDSVCTKGTTFSHIFGSRSSFLELLLLNARIKGPCWLLIKEAAESKNYLSWCSTEMVCSDPKCLSVLPDWQSVPPPPLVVATINLRSAVNTKNLNSEIYMLSCLVHHQYRVNRPSPSPNFQEHFCVLTKPYGEALPFGHHEALQACKATKVQKCDSERAMLNYFMNKLKTADPDLILGHDLVGYQLNILCERLIELKITNWSRIGKIRRIKVPNRRRLQEDLMVGRLVCDLKIMAKELIKARSYDLNTLCETVLKLKETDRLILDDGEVLKMFSTSDNMLQLISLTMQDSAYITRMIYDLNVMPLALHITNIAGNLLSKTLLGGRSERNEFLLLHAFNEKDYIVPDKRSGRQLAVQQEEQTRRKPTYLGGLVLDPVVGFYDKYVLLMDFNSLYPSVIQEYNICFTTVKQSEEPVLPETGSEPGILPTEIRKLVESRREVKKLMANPDLSKEQRMQYNIRQLALKLTANSMYGCLGFAHSRFYAKHLAAMVTLKGREILSNTRDLVQRMNLDVIYGDTDSIMINTNCLDYAQVSAIGSRVKQEVNRMYRLVELEVDGVFRYLLLLKKKKYAAVTVSVGRDGKITYEQEHKGLDIVRRDWCGLASEAGKFTLNCILSEQNADERVENVLKQLGKIRTDLEQSLVPLQLLIIRKQLNKEPRAYGDKSSQPHVLVALRWNESGKKPLRAGDTVPYIICCDGTESAPTQRGYHVEELKTSTTLKVDIQYYLAQQVHPIITRICDPIDGIDSYRIALALGLDGQQFQRSEKNTKSSATDETVALKVNKYQHCKPFVFRCIACRTENTVKSLLLEGGSNSTFLDRCENPECKIKPITYLPAVQNELVRNVREHVKNYYSGWMMCEDPGCEHTTRKLFVKLVQGKNPRCSVCKMGVMVKKYTEKDLYHQLSYFLHLFDQSTLQSRNFSTELETAVHTLRETVEHYINRCGYSVINLSALFSQFTHAHKAVSLSALHEHYYH